MFWCTQEEHTVKTNINGLAYLTIGNGKILNGLITSIDWSKGPYFIKSETDPTGGKNYTIVVLSQMLSVPYAIYSSTAEKLTGTLPETDPVFNGSIAKGITATDTSYWNKKLNSTDILGMLANYRTGLNQKLNITDTTKMLVPYLRDADTTNMLANYRTSINNKLDTKDTTLMLSNYLKKSEAINEIDPVFNGSIAKGITPTDTSYWNKKLNSTDTSGMLANYRTSLNSKLNSFDTTKMLSVYLRSTDTIQMSNKIQELVSKVSNLDSNNLNFNSSYTLKSFTVSKDETQIFTDTLLRDNEIWEFQIFMRCSYLGPCGVPYCDHIVVDMPISFLDANEIKLKDNSYFKSYKALGLGYPSV
jgi:hypothetical protein